MDSRAGAYDDVLFVWTLTEDDDYQPGTNETAFAFASQTMGTTRGVSVGDADTLPTGGVFKDSPMRTAVGVAIVVRTSDMRVLGNFEEFEIDELFASFDTALGGAHPTPTGELDFSRCEGGPFQAFETCRSDDECVGAARCALDVAGDQVCTPSCSSDNVLCDGDATCVLGEDRGECKLIPVGEGAPAAALCDRDSDCQAGLCLPVSAIGRTACRVSCEASGECGDGYICAGSACVLAPLVDKPEFDEAEGCSQSSTGPWTVALLLGLALVATRRRR